MRQIGQSVTSESCCHLGSSISEKSLGTLPARCDDGEDGAGPGVWCASEPWDLGLWAASGVGGRGAFSSALVLEGGDGDLGRLDVRAGRSRCDEDGWRDWLGPGTSAFGGPGVAGDWDAESMGAVCPDSELDDVEPDRIARWEDVPSSESSSRRSSGRASAMLSTGAAPSPSLADPVSERLRSTTWEGQSKYREHSWSWNREVLQVQAFGVELGLSLRMWVLPTWELPDWEWASSAVSFGASGVGRPNPPSELSMSAHA